jgi:hypothetical protein
VNDVPDLYIDGLSLSVGPVGITVTLLRSEPMIEEGRNVEVPRAIIGRIRMSHAMGAEFARILATAIQGPVPSVGGKPAEETAPSVPDRPAP